MRTVYIYLNGILNFPGDGRGWTGRAQTWTNLNTEAVGEKYEYLTTALFHRFRQQKRARKIATMIDYYARAGWTIRLVGHSNGCDILIRALKLSDHCIDELHLISAATEADFESNGLNEEIRTHGVNRVVVYISGKDLPLRLARFAKFFGTLGLDGPVNMRPDIADRVQLVKQPSYGHSSWFKDEHFDQTMREVTLSARLSLT